MAGIVKVGIIGGTGFCDEKLFDLEKTESVTTPFGEPSGVLKHGKMSGVHCVLLSRHGKNHRLMPTNVNYKANIYALMKVGCTHVLAATACGSLQEHMKPLDFVVIDSFIDRTTRRLQTFYDGSCSEFPGILHLPMFEPFCPNTRQVLIDACDKHFLSSSSSVCHVKGTMVTIEGPRFSTRAESKMFRILGGDVINMTSVPEVILARELGLCYASLAMVTDYDCWRESEKGVDVVQVMEAMRCNTIAAKKVIETAVKLIGEKDWSQILKQMKESVSMNVMLPN